MTQEDINESEWGNLRNWSAGVYRSAIDNRMFVPKRNGFGLTVNFGNRSAKFVFFALLAQPLIIFAVLWLAGFHFGRR
jgi:uncharacterized membrane protein